MALQKKNIKKRCKIFITPSAIIENMKIDFDHIDSKELSVKAIKASFPEVFQTEELHFLALRYITQRIIDDAKSRKLCTVFYRNLVSQNKGPIEEEPAKMYFLVNEHKLSLVKKALAACPIVKLNRIYVKKEYFKRAICSVRKYDKVCKKLNDKEKGKRGGKQTNLQKKCRSLKFAKKRLKISRKEHLYVKKRIFKIAKKALTCKVQIRKLNSEEIKIFMNDTVKQSSSLRNEIDQNKTLLNGAPAKADKIVSKGNYWDTLQNVHPSNELYNAGSERYINDSVVENQNSRDVENSRGFEAESERSITDSTKIYLNYPNEKCVNSCEIQELEKLDNNIAGLGDNTIDEQLCIETEQKETINKVNQNQKLDMDKIISNENLINVMESGVPEISEELQESCITNVTQSQKNQLSRNEISSDIENSKRTDTLRIIDQNGHNEDPKKTYNF